MKKIIISTIILLLFISCSNPSLKNDGGLLIELKFTDEANNLNQQSFNNTLNTISKRLDHFFLNKPTIKPDYFHKTIEIELPSELDTTLYRTLLTSKGELEVYGTFNIEEVYPFLKFINDTINSNPNLIKQYIKDTLAFKSNTNFFNYLRPSITSDNHFIAGPIVGYFHASQQQLVEEFLNCKDIQFLKPKDLVFVQGAKTEQDFIPLFAVKKPKEYTPITNKMIESFRIYDDNGNTSINISFWPKYRSTFADFTRRNIDYSIAFIIDKKVYSYPLLTSEILNGNALLTGDYTTREFNMLHSILELGRLNNTIELNKLTIVEVP